MTQSITKYSIPALRYLTCFVRVLSEYSTCFPENLVLNKLLICVTNFESLLELKKITPITIIRIKDIKDLVFLVPGCDLIHRISLNKVTTANCAIKILEKEISEYKNKRKISIKILF